MSPPDGTANRKELHPSTSETEIEIDHMKSEFRITIAIELKVQGDIKKRNHNRYRKRNQHRNRTTNHSLNRMGNRIEIQYEIANPTAMINAIEINKTCITIKLEIPIDIEHEITIDIEKGITIGIEM